MGRPGAVDRVLAQQDFGLPGPVEAARRVSLVQEVEAPATMETEAAARTSSASASFHLLQPTACGVDRSRCVEDHRAVEHEFRRVAPAARCAVLAQPRASGSTGGPLVVEGLVVAIDTARRSRAACESPAFMLCRTALVKSPRAAEASAAARWIRGTRPGASARKPSAEEYAEQMVIPIPAARFGLHQKQVRGSDVLEVCSAVRPAPDCVTQVSVEGIQLRRDHQELSNLRRLKVDHLIHQEVDETPVCFDEPAERLSSFAACSQRKTGKMHSRRPTFRQAREGLEIVRLEFDSQSREEQLRLLGRQAQVSLARSSRRPWTLMRPKGNAGSARLPNTNRTDDGSALMKPVMAVGLGAAR